MASCSALSSIPNLLIFLLIASTTPSSYAAVPCNATNNQCEVLLWKGSQCKNGFCTNPFQGGCLKSILNEDEYPLKYSSSGAENENALFLLRQRALSVQRVCNSEDEADSPHCQTNSNDGYQEVRIFPQNWESAIATSWIIQIMLSELLGVPATLETGVELQNNNFYNEVNQMDYGVSDAADKLTSFQNAFDAEEGDCVAYKSQEGGQYVPCAHYMPEVWKTTHITPEQRKTGLIEVPRLAGAVGTEGWRITKFSIDRDPSLAFYHGYQGEKNRQKLADTFKRPITWREYCTSVSSNNCTIPDDTAQRAPASDGSEDGRYFVAGEIYTGHFRATDKNNCTKTEKCTGHFMDYPCDWTSYFRQQAHHLGISLEGKEVSEGISYTYSNMVDIWKAANATGSDLIGMWWKPDAVITSFFGTESELVHVTLPSATVECSQARISDETCSNNVKSVGEEVGACDTPPNGLRKVIVGNMKLNIEKKEGRKAGMSPAYDVINNFEISELQLDQILAGWTLRNIDPYNFDLRFATCKWIADNLEYVQKYIPQSHPQVFTSSSLQASPVSVSALAISALAICVTVAAAYLSLGGRLQCNCVRKLDIHKSVQPEFVYLLITGHFLVSVGALLMAIPSSNGSCVSSVWFLNVGYTLVLVPILVRVSAIIKVVAAAKKLRRVTVDKKKLLEASFGISAISAIFCAVWTGVDPLVVHEELTTTNEKNDLGETIVLVSYYCESNSTIWYWVSFTWQCLLLVGATFLAFQMRSAPAVLKASPQTDLNSLAFMIYSSSMFLMMRIVLYVLSSALSEGSINKEFLQKVRSLLWSLDSVVNICIYFSKFFLGRKNAVKTQSFQHSNQDTPEYTVGKSPRDTAGSTELVCLGQHGPDGSDGSNLKEDIEEEKVEEDDPTRKIESLGGGISQRESLEVMHEQNAFLWEENAELKRLLKDAREGQNT